MPAKAPSTLATADRGSLVAGLGYGWGKDQGIDRWKVAVVFAFGYTLHNGAHVGVFLDHFWGETVRDGLVSTKGQFTDFGLAGGYDFALSQSWVFRLRGDMGMADLFTKRCVTTEPVNYWEPTVKTCSDEGESAPLLGTGASIIYMSRWSFFTEVRELFAFPEDGRFVHATVLMLGAWPPRR